MPEKLENSKIQLPEASRRHSPIPMREFVIVCHRTFTIQFKPRGFGAVQLGGAKRVENGFRMGEVGEVVEG